MIVLKDFEQYIPEDGEKLDLHNLGITCIKNELGDWYDIRYTLSEGKTKVLLHPETKKVVGQTDSINGLWPLGFILVELDEYHDDNLIGLAYDDSTGTFNEYVPSDEEALEYATRKLAGLRSVAQAELESLKLAEEIDTLDKDEKDRMKVLKSYLVELMRVPKQKGYPRTPIWPELKK